MKILFQNADHLLPAISLVAQDLNITLTDKSPDITVTVSETPASVLSLSLQKGNASITYGGGKACFFRGLATLIGWVRDGMDEQQLSLTPTFSFCGAMLDMSRNAVMNLPTVKLILRKMALMGMNACMLYTEDTYQVTGRPYFGYMRGVYTKEELRELDAYALSLGIELIPCIQTLGHLATALRWSATAPKDTSDVLMVGAEETYRFIEELFCTVKECFTTRRIHIGLDETHSLGTGNSLDQNGYRPREELFLEHLNRVSELALSHGFKPMMWSDMFFRMSGAGLENLRDYDIRITLREDISSYVPKNVQQVFWDYYVPDEHFYSETLKKHRSLGENTMFAGGVWTWSGHCPFFSRSINHTVPALEACRKQDVREVLATVWHNGSECQLILALAGLALYADYNYRGFYDEESVARCFLDATGEDYREFLKLEQPEHPSASVVACTRALLYNDPLLGLADKNAEGLELSSHYQRVLREISMPSAEYAPAFQTVRALTDLLINKADFGIRLTRAYREQDRRTLADMAAECDTVIQKLCRLKEAHRTAWMQYNKPFGWEVHDIRYGGLISRFETAKERITAYLAGALASLEELEADRLRFDCSPEGSDPFGKTFLWYNYSRFVTGGRLD